MTRKLCGEKCHELQGEAYPLQDDLLIFIHPITAIYLSREKGRAISDTTQ